MKKNKRDYRKNGDVSIPLFLLIAGVFSFFFPGINFADEYMQVPAAIQVTSVISDGKYTISQIAALCKKHNFKVVVVTDRDLMRWEYGIWPLRSIVKKTVEQGSVRTYGVTRYLNEIDAVQIENTDMVIMPGVESAPMYYWKGIPWSKKFAIMDWHKHFLVFGLDKAASYEYLPVVGNSAGLARKFSWKFFGSFAPVLFIVLGLRFLFKRTYEYKDESGRPLTPISRKWVIIGSVMIISGVSLVANNFPFTGTVFDQYHGKQGVRPYQYFIDYVNREGGFTFFAHPEVENIDRQDNIDIITKEHSALLLEAQDYTGFAVFHEGAKKVGVPGGIWDLVLNEYRGGKRLHPVWAIGAMGFDMSGNLESYLIDVRTVLLVPSLNRSMVRDAFKKGRMYAVRGGNSARLVLRSFTVTDSAGGKSSVMGESACVTGNPVIEIKGDFLNGQNKPVKIKLIKNGDVLETFDTASPFDITYEDDMAKPQKGNKSFYRIVIEAEGAELVANPIFIFVSNDPCPV